MFVELIMALLLTAAALDVGIGCIAMMTLGLYDEMKEVDVNGK